MELLSMSVTLLNSDTSALAVYPESHLPEFLVGKSPSDLSAGNYEAVMAGGLRFDLDGKPSKPVRLERGRAVTFPSQNFLAVERHPGSAPKALHGGTHSLQVRIAVRANRDADARPPTWERSKMYVIAAPTFAIQIPTDPNPKGSCFK
jgi:hypothetical protein